MPIRFAVRFQTFAIFADALLYPCRIPGFRRAIVLSHRHHYSSMFHVCCSCFPNCYHYSLPRFRMSLCIIILILLANNHVHHVQCYEVERHLPLADLVGTVHAGRLFSMPVWQGDLILDPPSANLRHSFGISNFQLRGVKKRSYHPPRIMASSKAENLVLQAFARLSV